MSPANIAAESISQRHLLCFSMINLNKIPARRRLFSHDEWRRDVRQKFLRPRQDECELFKVAGRAYSFHCCVPAPDSRNISLISYTCPGQIRDKKCLINLGFCGKTVYKTILVRRRGRLITGEMEALRYETYTQRSGVIRDY